MSEQGIFRGNAYDQYTRKEMLKVISKQNTQIKTTPRQTGKNEAI